MQVSERGRPGSCRRRPPSGGASVRGGAWASSLFARVRDVACEQGEGAGAAAVARLGSAMPTEADGVGRGWMAA